MQCPSAFIGSEIVYQEVRRLMKAEDMYTTISIWKIKDLVTSAIESGIDKTVGKYVTAIVYNNIEPHFQYVEYYYANSGLPTQRIGPGECIKFKLGAEKGSYNYQIYESNRNVALYIHEPQIGVVYTSDDDDAPYGLKGLLLPHSMEIDQLDFDAFAYYYGATKSISTTGLSPTQEIEEIEKRKKIYSTETVEFMLYSKYLDYMQNSPLLIK